MNKYVPELSVRQRPHEAEVGETGIFISMPNGADYNIWSVPKKLSKNKDFLNAVKSAFERGWEACIMYHSQRGGIRVTDEVRCDEES